ncbi:beta-hexosaminidase [Sphingomonas sp. Leaf412]|nr:beta-hexosaminidase [Sphingomonas sp. Leaf412]
MAVRLMRPLLAGLVASVVFAGAAGAQQMLLPAPAHIVARPGGFVLRDGARIAVPAGDRSAAATARLLVAQVRAQRGLTLVVAGAGDEAIRLVRDAAVAGAEAYRLTVDARGIEIAASGDRGLLYGAMTLAQLASPDRAIGRPATIPAMRIDDAPRFAWRGLMIDPARHFQPVGVLKDMIDQMAAVKLNTLHLHLTDDQGWRMEIRKYPKLTQVGAWRIAPSTGGPPPSAPVGGAYTQADLRGLVAYAAERGVTIVPEIDLPGHATALVAAYPDLGILGDRPPVSHDWGIMPHLFNPDPRGMQVVRDVLDEVMAVFPGTYIHLGGDEAVKDQWERSPKVQAQMKALGLKDENALQRWMIEQFGAYLQSKGRRLIGWDEILDGGLPASASIMSWRGEKGGIEAANAGHDVVLSPGGPLYLNHTQSDRIDEPPGRFGLNTLEAVYRYDPMPAGIAPDRERHVLGAQGNLWSEYIVTPRQLQHHAFPRAGAVAEITWAAKGAKDFAAFLPRLHRQAARWARAGVNVADSAFAVDFAVPGTRGDALRTGRVPVRLATQVPYGTIRYTTDGRVPTARSTAYAAPLSVAPGTIVRAAAFDAGGVATAAPRAFDTSRAALLSRVSSEMAACPAGSLGLRVPLRSESTDDAPAFNINLFDTCTLYPDAPLDVARGYRVEVARLARHYGLAHEARALRAHYAVSDHGELLVQVGCIAAAKARAAGDKAARPIAAGAFPLPDPATAPQQFAFEGVLPRMAGDHDMCFQFTSPLSDPYYTVARVQLTGDAR